MKTIFYFFVFLYTTSFLSYDDFFQFFELSPITSEGSDTPSCQVCIEFLRNYAIKLKTQCFVCEKSAVPFGATILETKVLMPKSILNDPIKPDVINRCSCGKVTIDKDQVCHRCVFYKIAVTDESEKHLKEVIFSVGYYLRVWLYNWLLGKSVDNVEKMRTLVRLFFIVNNAKIVGERVEFMNRIGLIDDLLSIIITDFESHFIQKQVGVTETTYQKVENIYELPKENSFVRLLIQAVIDEYKIWTESDLIKELLEIRERNIIEEKRFLGDQKKQSEISRDMVVETIKLIKDLKKFKKIISLFGSPSPRVPTLLGTRARSSSLDTLPLVGSDSDYSQCPEPTGIPPRDDRKIDPHDYKQQDLCTPFPKRPCLR